uniref:DUF8077 domain-containing protein n=1 Tax=Heterorhabditis bacteriophora TaxID=37862 RepID=A0A1I7WYZ7_HETBA
MNFFQEYFSNLFTKYSLVILIILFPISLGIHTDDPSLQELDIFDWTSGIRVAYCVDAPLPDILTPFRRTVSKIVTKYCQNITACNLKKQYNAFYSNSNNNSYLIEIIFFNVRELYCFIVNRNDIAKLCVEGPSAKKAHMISKHLVELSNRLGWSIISYEKYPQYDSMTEFMNIAIIPIVIFSVPLMVFLAYWTSTLRPNMSSDAWLVTGAAGGKNAALRRTMEIIAEQNAEIDRQNRLEMTKHIAITGGNEGITTTGQLLLNVARLSMASTKPISPSSEYSPQIVVHPGSSSTTGGPVSRKDNICTIQMQSAHPQIQLLNVVRPSGARRTSRRQSSTEEIKQLRRARGAYSKSTPKTWKAGSLISDTNDNILSFTTRILLNKHNLLQPPILNNTWKRTMEIKNTYHQNRPDNRQLELSQK